MSYVNGRRLRGLRDGPPKLRWGTAHAFVPSNISRTTVIECEAEYELTKKKVLRKNFVR